MQPATAPAPEWRVAYHAGPGSNNANNIPVVLGESPVWSAVLRSLLFVDIDGRRLHRIGYGASAGSAEGGSGPATDAADVALGDPVSHECVSLPWLIGSVGLLSSGDGSLCWLATAAGVHLFCWSTLRSTLLLPLGAAADRPDTRFNDAKAAPSGDLWAGTLVTESNAAKRRGRGHLHCLSARRFAQMGALNRLAVEPPAGAPMLAGATLSNGLDFLPPSAGGPPRLIWTDTARRSVEIFDMHGAVEYDASSVAAHVSAASTASTAAASSTAVVAAPSAPLPGLGVASLASRRTLVDCTRLVDPATGTVLTGDPDGLTLDAEGGLWVALNGGGCVVRIDFAVALAASDCASGSSSRRGGSGSEASVGSAVSPTRNPVTRVVRFPVSKVTSLCFGGPALRSLFVTSASKGTDPTKEPLAGSVFVVPEVGVSGCPPNGLRGNFALDGAPHEILQHTRVEQRPRAKL